MSNQGIGTRLIAAFSILVLLIVGLFLTTACISPQFFIDGITNGVFIEFYANKNSRMILGYTGALFVFLSIIQICVSCFRLRKEQVFSFENSNGKVKVAFSAIEGFVRRRGLEIKEIKDLVPKVYIGKNGLQIKSKVILKSDVDIPSSTSKLQESIKDYVGDVLGIKDLTSVEIYVTKIAKSEIKRVEVEEGIK
ncbi:alkaline shock response membrane anchor protein AmaP [bacterium]|nr:alkaline shock response membrane anchor protein AmaP [bacterium]